MGFCSYCGATTEGHSAACEGCRARIAATRSVSHQSQRQDHAPIENHFFSNKRIAIAALGLLALAVVILASPLAPSGAAGTKPTLREVEPLVRAYLEKDGEICSISYFSNLSVGDFDTLLGGWPVYVSHKTICRDGRTTTTYDQSRAAEKKVAATFVRRGMTGSLQTFKPALIKQLEQEVQRDADKFTRELDGMFADFDRKLAEASRKSR